MKRYEIIGVNFIADIGKLEVKILDKETNKIFLAEL